MPIFDVKGLLVNKKTRMKVVEAIVASISIIESLELKPEHIFPRVHDSKHITQKDPGKLVTIDVRELFTVGYNEKSRTKKERGEICDALKKGFNQFVEEHEWAEDEVRPENVVVYISMRDRAENEYDSWEVPVDHTECRMHGSIEHMQSLNGKCPDCKKP